MSEGQPPPAAATPPPPPVPTPSAEVPEVKQEPINPLNTDPNTWEGMLNTFIIWVAKDPWTCFKSCLQVKLNITSISPGRLLINI